MKKLFFILILSITSTAFADSYVAFISNEYCPGKTYHSKTSTVYCKVTNANAVKTANVGAKVTPQEYGALKLALQNVIDLGIVPDADSSIAYSYDRWLVDSSGKKVGIITIQGWTNNEMNNRARFDIRFSLKGDVVSVEEKNM